MASATRNKLAAVDKKRTIEQTLAEEEGERNSSHNKFSRFHQHLDNKESQSVTIAELEPSQNTSEIEVGVKTALNKDITNKKPENELASADGQIFQFNMTAESRVCNGNTNPSTLDMKIKGGEIAQRHKIVSEANIMTTDTCQTTNASLQQSGSLESACEGIQAEGKESSTKQKGLMDDTYSDQGAASLLPDRLQLSLHDVLSISKDCFIKGLVRVRVAHVKKTADKFAATVVDEHDDNTHVYLTGDLQSAFIGIKPGQLYGLRFSEWNYSEKRLAISSSTQATICGPSLSINASHIPHPPNDLLPPTVFTPLNELESHSDGRILNVRGKLIQLDKVENTSKSKIPMRKAYLQDGDNSICSVKRITLWRQKTNLPALAVGANVELRDMRKITYMTESLLESIASSTVTVWNPGASYGCDWQTRNTDNKNYVLVGISYEKSTVYPACEKSDCRWAAARRVDGQNIFYCTRCNCHYVDSPPAVGIVLSVELMEESEQQDTHQPETISCRIFRRALNLLGFVDSTVWTTTQSNEDSTEEIKEELLEKVSGLIGTKFTGVLRGNVVEVIEKL